MGLVRRMKSIILKGEIKLKKVLTIAGSDSSGGAGIQADIKTITAHKMYAMSVITALTAQNTMKVSDVLEVSPKFVSKQMDSVFEDIFPDSVKTGMLPSAEIIETVAEKLTEYSAKNIVVDPVMVSTSGCRLSQNSALDALKKCLLPIADVITPNIYEAQVLCGIEIKNKKDMQNAAEKIRAFTNAAVLIKGGHLQNEASDLLLDKSGEFKWFSGKRINNPNTHGTGCTLSSSIACNLAKGCNATKSIENAKNYINDALLAMLDLGHGSGPLNHMCRIK